MALELEYKFAFAGEPPGEGTLAALLRPQGWAVERCGSREQRDRYFDYFDSDAKSCGEGVLAQAGVALRIRRVGEASLAALKRAGEQQGGLHRREELELPFAGAWPPEIRTVLHDLAEPDALEPVMEIDTVRKFYLVVRADEARAELAFDGSRARWPVGYVRGPVGEVAFGEVELEALTVEPAALARLAGALQRGLALRPSALSKLERARTLLKAERAGA